MRRLITGALLVLLAHTILACATRTDQVGRNEHEVTLNATTRLSAHLGPDVRLTEATRVHYPHIGEYVDYGHGIELKSGKVVKVALDSEGIPTNGTSVTKHVLAARRSERVSNDVLNYAAILEPTEQVPIKVWFPMLQGYNPRSMALADGVSQAKRSLGRLNASRVSAISAEIVALGGKVVAGRGHVPFVLATVPASSASLLRSAVPSASYIAVDPVEIPEVNSAYTDLFDADDHEVRETFTQASPPVDGAGARVGLYEAGTCGVNYLHPGLANATVVHRVSPYHASCSGMPNGTQCSTKTGTCANDYGYCIYGMCMKEHVTAMASAVGSAKASRFNPSLIEKRGAHAASMYYANWNYSRADSLAWLDSHDVTVIVDAEGVVDPTSVNAYSRNSWITIVGAVGNDWAVEVDTYANAISVGGFGVELGATDTWKMDAGNSLGKYGMSINGSCYKDSSVWFDAEKPDVVALSGGQHPPMVATNQGGGLWGFSIGSSAAAAQIGGLVALLQTEYSILKIWPEAVRAILMASALHNISGAFLSRNGGDDEEDGAGAPKASTSKKVLDENTYRLLTLRPADFIHSPNAKDLVSVSVPANATLRAVLSWQYCAEDGESFYAADFDLELTERADGGAQYAGSGSFTNSVEMLSWRNGSSQPLTVFIRAKYWGQWLNCGGIQREYASLAWILHDDNGVAL